jgi:hypothetical protein
MTNERRSFKEAKKEPTLTPKERKALKKDKKAKKAADESKQL